MASQKQFNLTPTVSITRSKFKRPSQHKTTFKLGEIVPIYVDEVLPGDTRSINVAGLVRMATPITDLMDNIHLDLYAFFVPNRLLWNDWKKFMGENTSGAGAMTDDLTIPQVSITGDFRVRSGSLGDYMGLPLEINSGSLSVSALPGRAYVLIYNEWFRDQNIIAPNYVYTDSSGAIGGGALNGYYMDLLVAAKDSDYFTRALPYAQKGNAVTLPLGTKAPIYLDGQEGVYSGVTIKASGDGTDKAYLEGYNGSGQITGQVWANLSTATAATINDLRFAFAYQKLLEKDCLYGTRYWELLKAHFGITAPDASLQRPQYLGGKRVHINIDQVLSHSGFAADDSQEVGAIGGVSVTGFNNNLFTFSSVEHGQLMILAVARHDQSYSQGVNRMWSRKKRYDFYFPVFANLGQQSILNKEIYAQGTSADDETFGFQEAWAEYRFKPSITTGKLNPNAGASLPYWTLTNKFNALPTLGKVFIEQGRENISRVLTTGDSAGFDFIADFLFDETAVRPMPMYSIPGLIDHH